MKKTFLLLTALGGLILGWCSVTNNTVTITTTDGPSVADTISVGDSVGAQDSVQVVWPTSFNHLETVCVDAQNCSETNKEVTGYFKSFTSSELGISFSIYSYGNYMLLNANEPFAFYYTIVRSGNAVYIVGNTDETPSGQWVEMFEKLPNETLEQAIKRVANIEGSWDCVIESAAKVSFDDSTYGPRYKGFIINYPDSKLQASCPPDTLCYADTFCGKYAVGGSVKIFIGSEEKNKFYFIDGGQDPFPGLWGKSRYQELQFLE